jgi:hypothetical protein
LTARFPQGPESIGVHRHPSVLWAGAACLLDESSPSMQWTLALLRGLAARGWLVRTIEASVFNDPAGMGPLLPEWPRLRACLHRVCQIEQKGLRHWIHVVETTQPEAITHVEEGALFHLFLQALQGSRPDLLLTSGAGPFDWMLAEEAREQRIGVVALCVDARDRTDQRWAWDVDLVLTADHTTAEDLRTRLGVAASAVGVCAASPSNAPIEPPAAASKTHFEGPPPDMEQVASLLMLSLGTRESEAQTAR